MTNKPKKPVTETVAPVAAEEVIHSIKGFGLDWKCRDFQFEAGNTYEITGPIVACKTGFHAIEGNPIEVFGYYAPGQSRYAEVKQSGALSRDANDGKLASAKITIGVEITVHDLVERAVKWVVSKCVAAGSNHAEGNRSAASSTGYQSAASSTGDQSAASSTGNRSAASSTGYQSAASSTGDQSAASSTGNRSAASSTGYQSAASSTGYQSAASSTGNQSAAMSSGRFGKVMGKKGNALFLVYRDDDFNIVHAWAGIAGSDGIKADTWYCLDAEGKPEEIK
jgi:hypothetical protein